MCPFAGLFERLGDDEPVVFVGENGDPTVLACDSISKLSQQVGLVPNGFSAVCLINTWAVDEVMPYGLV